MTAATQKIFRIRRDYNTWVANETMEDYALRYTPRSFRKWSEFRVANTAFGAVSFLALEAIGGTMTVNYGFTNAAVAILIVSLLIFLTGLPISYYAARYGVDMDLLTRGAGFGYLGSTMTSLIYATFTFIFFAIEAAIMAQALQIFLHWPIEWCYLLSSLIAIPLVTYGVTMISRLQWWTQAIWLALWLCPFLYILVQKPAVYVELLSVAGSVSGSSSFDWRMFGLATMVAFSLIVQIGEQVDYLRFMPELTRQNRVKWWSAVLVAGPGWVIPGLIKMLGGAFLAFLALQNQIPPMRATEPTQMYLAAYSYVFSSPTVTLVVTALFVIISQIKINVTNAYAGSLAWSNFFARATHSHPGRVVWLVFNVVIATLLMLLGVFQALEEVLAMYANVAVAWIGALVADLLINKPLGLSPKHIEFKRAHLFDINPVGPGAMVLGVVAALLAYFGYLGHTAAAFSPFIALFVAMFSAPLIALATKSRFYIARQSVVSWKPGELVTCAVCENRFEAEDIASCPAYGAPICSLCCTLEARCHDRCKQGATAPEQLSLLLQKLLPPSVARCINFRVGHHVLLVIMLVGLIAAVLGLNYYQASVAGGFTDHDEILLRDAFVRSYAMLAVLAALGAWWVVLANESRRIAEDESTRQNQLLSQEIEAHRQTDAALERAKQLADSANLAKTRYVTGVSHELRTPLNSILGYSQVLLHDMRLDTTQLRAIQSIQRSGEHLSSLIEGLLDLARIEAGRLKLDPAVFDLGEFLDELERMIAPQARAKGLIFELKIESPVLPRVRADLKRLRQVLINLLVNAVKFTSSGRVMLRVQYRLDVVRFEVLDTGPGIAAEDIERIFLPFERSSSGRQSTEPGTGLGLTITKLLTELMGGEIQVDSRLGHGSSFRVRLYLPTVLTAAGDRVTTTQVITGYAGPRRRLLLVDDQAMHRQLLIDMIARIGFDYIEAGTGRECLERVADSEPDMILMDISMAPMDGWETAAHVREINQTIPIVMVSANVFDAHLENLPSIQVQGFVSKPVMESELLSQLQQQLQLEWLSASPSSLMAATEMEPITALPSSTMPDEEVRVELVRLLRLGNIQAVRRELTRLTAAWPDHVDAWSHLERLLNHYDLDGCLTFLAADTDNDIQLSQSA